MHHYYAAEGAMWSTFIIWKESWPEADRPIEQAQRAVRTLALSFERGDLSQPVLDHYYRESANQTDILRDIFGNPFRPLSVNPTWRTFTVQQLADAIYQEQAFDRLPILADALEDAGCDNAELLTHLRQPGEHVRGCWALDLVLGKE